MRIYLIIISTLLLASCNNSNKDSNAQGEPDDTISNTLKKNHLDTLINDKEVKNTHASQYDTLTSDSTFYPSGMLHETIKYTHDGEGFTYKVYHQNGKLKTTGEQGNFNGCSTKVGTEAHYDTTGVLIQKMTFEHFLPEGDGGCHSTRTVISQTDYYLDGKIKSKKFFETCYECDSCNCGKWEFYDNTGKVIRSKNYENCYDFQLNCLEE